MKLELVVLLLISIYTSTISCTFQISVGPFESVEQETAAYEKSDVTGNQTGVPLEYRITVVRDGAPLPGMRVDIWSANALGDYSNIEIDGTSGQDWLRGFQFADENGTVTFQSIYPSNYRNRTNHVHFRLREYAIDGMNTIFDNTTQLFYPAEINDQVMALPSYSNESVAVNSNDWFYRVENEVTLEGDVDTGFIATYTIELPMIETPPNTETGIFPAIPGEVLILPGRSTQNQESQEVVESKVGRQGGVKKGRCKRLRGSG